MNGIIYYTFVSNYDGDTTKNAKILGAEIDSNFYFLRGMDISSESYFDKENKSIVLKRLNGDNVTISGISFGDNIIESNCTFDDSTGELHLGVDDKDIVIKGFVKSSDLGSIATQLADTLKEIEKIKNGISDIEEYNEEFSGTTDKKISQTESKIDAVSQQVVKNNESINNSITESNTKITNILKEIELLQSELKKQEKEISNISTSYDDTELKQKYEILSTSLNNLSISLDDNLSRIQQVAKNNESINNSITQSNTKINSILEEIELLQSELKKQEKEISNISTSYDDTELKQKYETLSTSLNNLSISLADNVSKIQNINKNQNDSINDLINGLSSEVKTNKIIDDRQDTAINSLKTELEKTIGDIATIDANKSNDIKSLSQKITTYIDKFEKKDAEHSHNIDSLKALISVVDEELHNEVSTRKYEDSVLQTQINGLNKSFTNLLNSIGSEMDERISVIQGPQGQRGPEGAQGRQGVQGAQGIIGPQGYQGNIGPQGEKGIEGAQGIKGVQGAQGICGIQGIDGVQGYQGAQGAQGAKGNDGSQIIEQDIHVEGIGSIGNYKDGDVIASGTTVQDILTKIFSKELNPSITKPSLSISLAQQGTYEVGQQISPSYTTTFNEGNYTYDKTTKVSLLKLSLSDTNGYTNDKSEGTFNSFYVEDNTNYSITATASYSDGSIPHTNLGNEYPSGQIKANTVTVESSSIKGYRNSFYGALSNKTETFTSDAIRTLSSSNSSTTKSFSVKTTDSDYEVVIAIPSTMSLKSVLNVAASNAECVDNFVYKTVSINGKNNKSPMDYKVYYYISNITIGTNEFKITIK